MARIRTVLGDISSSEFGLALPHEHVLCDFIGADKVSRDRYDSKEVFDIMLPYLEEIRQLGVKGFVDCSPAFLGRDPELLAKLSKSCGINMLTNTGLYKEPYLPKYAFEYSEDKLSEMWANEIEEGIEGTQTRGGFVKIAVNPGKIVPIQGKIVRSAVRCSISTGATVACHTAEGEAAMDLLKITKEEGGSPNKLIVVHTDAIEDVRYHTEIAKSGAWVEYDGVKAESADRTLSLLELMVEKGFDDRLLLSQDAGWYNVGEEGGGAIRDYAYLVRDFVPLMLKRGFSSDLVRKLTVTNPAEAFRLG